MKLKEMVTWDNTTQLWIAIFGTSAMWFISRPEDWAVYGFLLGLIGQPAWYYTTIKKKQWGIAFLSIFYTYSWCQGIWLKLIPYYHGRSI